MKPVRRFIVYLLLRSVMVLGRFLPWAFGGALFATGGRLAGRCLVTTRRRTLEHLRAAFGADKSLTELSKIASDCFAHFGRNLFEVIKLPEIPRERLETLVTISGEDHVREATSRDRGLLFVGGHIGNWELMAAVFAQRGYTLRVVAAPLYDPRLDALMIRQRRRCGIETIVRGRGGETARSILQCLKKKEVLVLLLDQDTKEVDGVFVQFFGKPAFTPSAAAVLAIRQGVPLISGSIWRDWNSVHHVHFDPPIIAGDADRGDRRIIEITQILTDRLETAIRSHPEQWVWMHNRWKRSPPPPNRSVGREKPSPENARA